MIDQIVQWYHTMKLKAHKKRALFEVKADIRYLLAFKNDMIKYDESKARSRMAVLKRMEKRTDVEDQELAKILEVLAESRATKNELEKSQELENDIENYISIL